jgi:hypothetical protein
LTTTEEVRLDGPSKEFRRCEAGNPKLAANKELAGQNK